MKSKKIFSWIMIAAVALSNITVMPYNAEITYAASEDGNFTLNGDTLTIKNGTDVIDMQICADNILRVDYKPGGQEDIDTEVLDSNQKWGKAKITKSNLDSDTVVLQTKDMTVKIGKSDLSLTVCDSAGSVLVKQGKLSAGSISFTHDSGENFYGITGYTKDVNASDGTIRNNGSFNVESGSQGYVGGPFVWSNGGYGLLVDSDGGKIQTGDTDLSYTGISKKDAEYFIIVGNPEEIAKGVSEASGKTPMYPKWAMGYTNTQWGWPGTGTVESQVKDVIGTYRSKDIPIDNFCFDFDWKEWGKLSDYGEFTWDSTDFPSAASGELKKWQEENGIHFTGIVKPRIFTGKENGKDTAEYAEMKAGGFINPRGERGSDYCASKDYVPIDNTTQAGRDFWWSCTQRAFDKGLYGYWNDEIDHCNGFGNYDNLYLQKAQYEGQRKYTQDQTRVWSINRSFYLGAQKYAYGIWTGDIGSGYQTMKGQAGKLIAAVNLGQNKWGMDTGGFTQDPVDDENYARWMQFSAFTPIFRTHGECCAKSDSVPRYNGAKVGKDRKTRYPWVYGSTAEAAVKDVMQLRYRLVPYIYKYEHDASEGGTGIVKTLMMQYPNDPNVSQEVYSWMFGDYMLVSPVLDKGQTEKEIYLPAGKWINYADGTEYEGGKKITVKIDDKTWKDVPIFIKEGAIIPSQKNINSIAKDTASVDKINLNVFPSAKKTTFEYYDDDGETYDYEDNTNVFKQELSVAPNGNGLSFKTGKKEGTYNTPVKSYVVKLHAKNIGDVTCNGKELTKTSTLEGIENAKDGSYAVGKDKYGEAVYVKIAAGDVNTINVECDVPQAAQQAATVYAKTAAGSCNYEYSTDDGETWSKGAAMTQSSYSGYLQADFKYALSSAENVRFRYKVDEKYYPSNDGVELSNEKSKFTIGKDGSVKNGTPSVSNANIYIASDNQPAIQVKDDTGWSDAMLLDKYGSEDGQYSKTISYDSDNDSVNVRYTTDGGKTWLPSEDGSKVSTGDFMSDSSGKIVSGRPKWDNSVVLYYKGSATNIHWRPLGAPETSWTRSPGDKMEPSEIDGYLKVTLNVGTASGAEACFNTNGGNWDSNGGNNYTINMGTNTFAEGKVTSGSPNGGGSGSSTTKGLTIASSIKGNTYGKAQSLTLTASDSSAKIYYTLDGKNPTENSTEYSEPIEISKSTTVKSIAIDSKGNKSVINMQSYIIDGSIIEPPNPDKLSKVSLKANKTSIKKGEKVTLTATPDIDDSSIQYEFGYYDDDDEWNVIRKYSSSNTYAWTTDTTGTFDIIVRAKSDDVDEIESNKVQVNVENYVPPIEYEKLSKVEVSSSTKSTVKGKKVTLTATCNTEDPSVEYEFGYYDSNDKWHSIRSYSNKDTYVWTTNSEGTFDIVVKAKSDDVDEIESKTCTVTVKPSSVDDPDIKLETVEIKVSKTSISVGQQVTLTAEANYDDGSNKYQFGYYDENNNWNSINSYSSKSTFNWTPTEAKTYNVCVKVKSDDVTTAIKSSKKQIKVSDKGSEEENPSEGDPNKAIALFAMMSVAAIFIFTIKKNYNKTK